MVSVTRENRDRDLGFSTDLYDQSIPSGSTTRGLDVQGSRGVSTPAHPRRHRPPRTPLAQDRTARDPRSLGKSKACHVEFVVQTGVDDTKKKKSKLGDPQASFDPASQTGAAIVLCMNHANIQLTSCKLELWYLGVRLRTANLPHPMPFCCTPGPSTTCRTPETRSDLPTEQLDPASCRRESRNARTDMVLQGATDGD